MKYKCPFCKMEIEDSTEALMEHRKDGGDCDQRMDENSSERV